MLELQIESVSEPLAQDPTVTLLALQLVTRTQFIGLMPSLPEPIPLTPELIQRALRALAQRGVARAAALVTPPARSSEDYRQLLIAAARQIEQSPVPSATWPVLTALLDEELLARLLGISPSSLRRYSRGQRPTPADVAARLHSLALLIADLSGAYNDYGIRRWFIRSRSQLGGRSPVEVLDGGFDPDGEQFAQVRSLVDALSASGAS